MKQVGALFVLTLSACHPGEVTRGLLPATSFDVYVDGSDVHLVGLGDAGVLYRRSENDGATWSEAVRIDSQAEAPRAGSDVQIAAMGERVIAAWSARGTGYMGSGPLVSLVSRDAGLTWTEGANPADDGSTEGHGFIDIAAGQRTFHLVWLDGRRGSQGLRHARSADGTAWSSNADVDPETCECCWNTIAMGAEEVFVLYRDKTPRDMALARLAARSEEFVRESTVGEFGWSVDACPHVGGGLAVGGGDRELHHAAIWTGGEDAVGVYYLTSHDSGRIWSEPLRFGGSGSRHADLAASGENDLAAVWDVSDDKSRLVMARYSSDGGETWSQPEPLSQKADRAHHPRVVATRLGFMAFWLSTNDDGDSQVVSRGISRGGNPGVSAGS
jgi:hypothetical protein